MPLANLAQAGYLGHLVRRINAGASQAQLQAYLRALEPGEHINSINAAINAARRGQAAAGYLNAYGQVSPSVVPNPQGLGATGRSYHYVVLYTAVDASGATGGPATYNYYSTTPLTSADIEARLVALLAMRTPTRVRGHVDCYQLGMAQLAVDAQGNAQFEVLLVEFV